MIETRALRGVIPVLSTPLTADGGIDHGGIERLVEFLVGKGVGGMWVLGTGGEDMNLTFAKRLEVAKAVTTVNAGRLPLILGAGFYALEDTTDFIAATADLEFDAYHVMPYHPLLGMDRVAWSYRHIADRASRPLWMYTSANWCQPFTPDFVAGLKDHPNIAGIKFSTQRTTDLLKVATLADAGFQVISAVAAQFYVTLSMGIPAATTSLGSPLPDPLLEIYHAYQAGEREESLRLQQRLNRFLSRVPKSIKRDNFLGAAEEKYILERRGICSRYTTSYYRDLNAEEMAQIDRALDEFGFLGLAVR